MQPKICMLSGLRGKCRFNFWSGQTSRAFNFAAHKLRLVADPVIEAIARLEFEDGMRRGVLPGGCWGP